MKRMILVLALLCAARGAAEAAPRQPVTPGDLYRFQWVADPHISPDGERVVFVRVRCDSSQGKDGYATDLWLSETASDHPRPRQLTVGSKDSSPRWSPQGDRLAFLRPDDKDKAQIWILPLEGGEALPLTSLKHGAGTPHWSPDGSSIAFNAGVPRHSPTADKKVRVITEPEFRANGRGFLDTRSQVFVADVHTGDVVQVTEGPFDASFTDWSPESSTVFFLSDRRSEPWLRPADADLYGVLRRGGPPQKVLDINGPLSRGRVNGGGQWALLGRINKPNAQSYNQLDLLLAAPAESGGARGYRILNRTAELDLDLGNAISTDMAPPRARGTWNPVWSNNGESVFVIVSERGTSNLARIDVEDGDVTRITPGDNVVLSMSATPDAQAFAFVMGDDKNPGDVWMADAKGKHLKRLTGFNDDLLADRYVCGPEHLVIPTKDGMEIDAWLIKPADYEPWNRHPLIVQIHGGPHIAYGEHFFHEFQVMAGRGYMVLYTNPRGSSTYGEEFAQEIQYAYPGGDIHDILAAVDSVSNRRTVDPERLGVTGGSGGGYLTNWMIIKDDRFKAAATQRCVSEWLSFYFTADFTLYTPFWFRKQPWESPGEYIERSPVYFANRVTTPLLILHSENDLRTPVNQAEAMFRALKGAGREAVMVRFPGEDHNLSRNGSPSMRVERLNYLLDWFDSYLLDKPATWTATGDE